MTSARRIAAIGAVFAAMCLPAAAQPPSIGSNSQIAAAAMSGRVLTRYELQSIYSGKTWNWKNGAAYFRPDRAFQAWVNQGADATYGEGSWSVSSNGQLCIRATWATVSGRSDKFTCYVHRSNGAIYQRELPQGSWYIFSHAPSQPGDEINKIERGDHISADFTRTKRYVLAHATAGEPD